MTGKDEEPGLLVANISANGIRRQSAQASNGSSRTGEWITAIDNPLFERDPQLFDAIAVHRDHSVSLLLTSLAAKDLHEPNLLGKAAHYDIHELKACAQVFDVLSRPQWTNADLQIVEGYFPYAWRSDLFGDCVEEARHRIRKALDDGAKEMSQQSGLTTPEPKFEF